MVGGQRGFVNYTSSSSEHLRVGLLPVRAPERGLLGVYRLGRVQLLEVVAGAAVADDKARLRRHPVQVGQLAAYPRRIEVGNDPREDRHAVSLPRAVRAPGTRRAGRG